MHRAIQVKVCTPASVAIDLEDVFVGSVQKNSPKEVRNES